MYFYKNKTDNFLTLKLSAEKIQMNRVIEQIKTGLSYSSSTQ